MKNKNNVILATLVFTMSFITGAFSMLIGSSLGDLAILYNKPLESVVIISSFFAAGRILSSAIIGKVSEKVEAFIVLRFCLIAETLMLLLVPFINQMYVGFALAFIGGVGFSGNDAICPPIMAYVFKDKYPSALSIGQAMYGLGTFGISFLVGLTITFSQPYYYAYWALQLFIVIAFVLTFVGKYSSKSSSQDGEETVVPLQSKNKILSYVLIILVTIGYCSVCNIVGLYTQPFALAVGIDQQMSAYLLTNYNIGGFIGSMFFTYVLTKYSERKILLVTVSSGLLAFILAFLFNSEATYFVLFFMAGFFLGTIFTLVVSLFTRINYQHVALSSSLVGLSGGIGDVTTPLYTSVILSNFGINTTFSLVFVVLTIVLICSIWLYVLVKEDKKVA